MCFFDNWGNFYNWNNWGNANVNITPNAIPVTDGGTFDPTSSVITTIGGMGSAQVYSVTFAVQTPQTGDSFFLDLSDTGLTQVGSQIFYGDILIATASGGEVGEPYVLTFSTASGSHAYRAGLITEVIDGVRFSNGGADESGSAVILITAQTSSGTYLPQVNVSYTAGVSAPGVGFDLTGGLSAPAPQQTVDDGVLYSERSGVTALADGGYVLVWQATGGPNNYDIFGQRYDASGQAVGGQFTVNTYTTNGQQLPQVSALADGGFVVVWQSFGQDGMNSGIYGQRYGADGLPEGAEFRANTTTNQNESNPSVVGLADGGYVVIWQTHDGVSAYVSRGQWYNAAGVAQGGEITLVTTSQLDGVPEATALADGGMAMLSQVYTGSQYELRLYIFDDAGAAVGSPTVVHTGYLGDGTHDITALEGGGFGVSWFENGAIKVQVFDDNGAAVGAVLTVPATANLNSLSVTDLAGGGFVVSWQGYIDGLWQVFAQAFGADGQADGGVASVSQGTYADTYAGQQSIAQLNDGTIVVTWTYNGQVLTRALEFNAPAIQTSEDGPAIPIILTGWDSDGSETLTVTLSGFPEGATFNQGQAGPGDTWVIAGADPAALLNLQMVEPVNYTGDFTLTVTVASVESSDNSSSSSTHEVDVVVGVNASTPVISIPRDGGTISNPGGIDTFTSVGPGIGNTALADGGFLTVSFQAGTYNVLVHRFDAAGEPVGGATTIANPAGTKTLPSIAAAEDGSYFVTWTRADGFDDIWAVFVDASGAAGTPFAVNTTTANSQVNAQVIATSDGGFLVVWQSQSATTFVPGIVGRKYDSSGAPEGGEFVIGVNYTTDYIQYQATQPRVTVLSDGSMLVVWQENPNGSVQEIHGQFLSADGTPQGTELTLLAQNGESLIYPGVVAVAGGGWVLSWANDLATHSQLFDADGSKIGDEFVVSTGLYNHAPITALPDGGYVVTWYANNDTLYAQRFDALGAEVGGVLTVGPGGPGYAAPAIVLDGDTLVFTYYYGGSSAGQVRTFDYTSHGLTGHEDGAIAVPIEMTWPDQDGSETLTVTLSGFPEDATFSQGAAGVGGTWAIVVSDPAALADLTMTAPAGFMGAFLLTVTATTVESADGSSSTVDQIVEITVAAGASDIAFTPSDFNGAEDTAIAVPLELSWPDTDGSETLVVTLSGFPDGATFSQGESGVGGTWVIEVSDPADLLDLTMTPPADWYGEFELEVSATATESANAATSTDSFTATVTVSDVSDFPPELTTPVSIAVTEDVATALSGISVADSDSPVVTLTLTVASGTLTAEPGGVGLTFGKGPALSLTITGNPSGADVLAGGTLTITGSPADINTFLDGGGVIFTPATDSTDDVTLDVSVSDGAQADSTTVTLDVSAVDDQAEIDSLPTSIEVDEDSSVAITGIVVSDVDSSPITVTLSLSVGALSATSADGVTVGGTSTALTLQGSASAINAFIAAGDVRYAPPADFNGPVDLSVSVSDGGPGDSGSITIDVQAVNDAPVITASPETASVDENQATALTGFVFADIDSSPVTVTFSALTGILSWVEDDDAFEVTGSGTGTVTIVASSALLNAAIAAGALQFLTSFDNEDDVAVTVTVADGEYEDGSGLVLTVQPDSIDGTSGADTLLGDSRANEINGFDGADVIYGYEGADLIEAGKGADIIYGGTGADTIVFRRGDGHDVVQDATGEDRIVVHGYAGYTVVFSGRSNDVKIVFDANNSVLIKRSGVGGSSPTIVLMGTEGVDSFIGGGLADEIHGLGGNDTIKGAAGNDTLEGEDGDDFLEGGVGVDSLNGGAGVDTLVGGAGADALNGGADIDYANYVNATAAVSLNLTTGVHTGDAAGDTFTLVERFQLSNKITQADSFIGGSGDDWVAGYKGVDTLFGMAGADTLNGGEQNDVLNGGAGKDKLVGWSGDDQLTGGSEADQFWVNAGLSGADTVTDFENGIDKIRISGVAGVTAFSDLTVSSNGAGWAVVTFPDGSTITLTGILASDVDATDFVWG